MAAAVAMVGVVAVLSWDDDPRPQRAAVPAPSTSTTIERVEVLGAAVDNTTSTAVAETTTTSSTTVQPRTTTARSGRIWGYSFASGSDEKTTVSLSRDGAVVAEKQTDAEGLFDFAGLPAGTYHLTRTTRSSYCPTTTTAGEQPKCTMASSRTDGPDVALAAGQDSRVDFF